MAHHPTPRRLRPLAGALVGLALFSGACRTTESTRPVTPEPAVVYRAEPVRAWNVLDGEELLGRVVYFASEKAPERSVYMVRNPYGQDLGWVDSLGRAYRLLPHHRDPAWVGTGTVAQGVGRILDAAEGCSLVETSLQEASADAPGTVPGG